MAIVKSHVGDVQFQYRSKVIPKLIDLGNYFYLEIVSPKIDAACQAWEEFDHKHYREASLEKLRSVRHKCWYYYTVYIRPNFWKLVHTSKLDKLNENACAGFHRIDQQYQLVEKYHQVHARIAPVAKVLFQRFQDSYELVLAKILPIVHRLKRNSEAKVEPVLANLWNRCRTDETCYKTHFVLKQMWKNIKLGLTYLKIYLKDAMAPYTEEIESVLSAKVKSGTMAATKSISKVKSNVQARATASGNARAAAKAGVSGVTRASASASADSTTAFSTSVTGAMEDEDEEVLSTTTSTVMLTVTIDDQELSPQETSGELRVAEQDMMQDEFDAWFRVVDQKSSSVVKSFNAEVANYLHKRVQELEPLFKNKTQNISQTMQHHFKVLNSAIQDINCTSETDKEFGNTTYFDSTGTTQLAEYISRPRMRELFADAHSVLDNFMLQVKEELAAKADEVDKRVNLIREELVEVYEEWGDAMVSEWSKRLAYIDVVAGHLEEKESGATEASSDNWRKFLNLKKQVIKARDQLAEHPADLQEMKQFIKKAEYLVQVISQDSGEYLYILRARANLAFQAREKEAEIAANSQRFSGVKAGANATGQESLAASKKNQTKRASGKKRAPGDTAQKAANGTNFTELQANSTILGAAR